MTEDHGAAGAKLGTHGRAHFQDLARERSLGGEVGDDDAARGFLRWLVRAHQDARRDRVTLHGVTWYSWVISAGEKFSAGHGVSCGRAAGSKPRASICASKRRMPCGRPSLMQETARPFCTQSTSPSASLAMPLSIAGAALRVGTALSASERKAAARIATAAISIAR